MAFYEYGEFSMTFTPPEQYRFERADGDVEADVEEYRRGSGSTHDLGGGNPWDPGRVRQKPPIRISPERDHPAVVAAWLGKRGWKVVDVERIIHFLTESSSVVRYTCRLQRSSADRPQT